MRLRGYLALLVLLAVSLGLAVHSEAQSLNVLTGIDAAVAWPNGKVYVFKGPFYLRYDLASGKLDDGYPRPIKDNWPGMPFTSIDAACVWPTGKAYFFKGTQYVRYDVAADRVD